jgi:hypothetical protein
MCTSSPYREQSFHPVSGSGGVPEIAFPRLPGDGGKPISCQCKRSDPFQVRAIGGGGGNILREAAGRNPAPRQLWPWLGSTATRLKACRLYPKSSCEHHDRPSFC